MPKYLSYDGLKHLWDSKLEPSLFAVAEYEVSESERTELNESGKSSLSIDTSSLGGGVRGVMLTINGSRVLLKADAYWQNGTLMRATANLDSQVDDEEGLTVDLILDVAESGTVTLKKANRRSGNESAEEKASDAASDQIQTAVVTSIDDLATKAWLGRKIIAMEYVSDGDSEKTRCGCVWELVYDKAYGTYSASVWRMTATESGTKAVDSLDESHYLNVTYLAGE